MGRLNNDHVVAFTTEPTYTATENGSYSVRAANDMGGLSAQSETININNVTGIETIDSQHSTSAMEAIYTLDGKRLQQLQRGLNIVKMSDGRMVKIIKK